jgi:hypothetical protein
MRASITSAPTIPTRRFRGPRVPATISRTIAMTKAAIPTKRHDGRNLSGADGLSLRLIGLLDPLVPDGSRVGQSECRAHAGVSLALEHFGQFPDFCNHLHLEVEDATEQVVLNKARWARRSVRTRTPQSL